jgi:hypothetical protein
MAMDLDHTSLQEPETGTVARFVIGLVVTRITQERLVYQTSAKVAC